MKALHCKPFLLSSFFHRIFYNVDDLFIFKKQFTTYHAVNSFFTYIFSQNDFSTSLSQISFCKTSGRLNASEAKIVEILKNRHLKLAMNGQSKAFDFEAIEKEEIKALSYIPFRMTSNI